MPVMTKMMKWLERCAEAEDPCPKNAEIAAEFDFESVSSSVSLLAGLQRDGLIVIERFQNARRVTIVSSGLKTSLPHTVQPHWRDLPQHAVPREPEMEKGAPYLAPYIVRRELSGIAGEIAVEADRRGQSMGTFLSELVAIGWRRFVELKVERQL
jgi:hypothetical protein